MIHYENMFCCSSKHINNIICYKKLDYFNSTLRTKAKNHYNYKHK